MSTVDIMVNGRHHTVQCGEGEEARVKRLASYLDQRVMELARGHAQVGDIRLLVMAAILVTDELSDAREELDQLHAALEERLEQVEYTAAAAVERVAQQINAIAAELEKS